MLSREEIEESKKCLEEAFWKGYIQKQNEATGICKQCKYRIKAREQETKEQKLIEKLEKENQRDTEKVRYYEKAYRDVREKEDEFYIKSNRRTIDMTNARRNVRKEVLEIIKKWGG